MSKLPCKLCKACGKYHDLSVTACDGCGADLHSVVARLVETEEIPTEARGSINEEVTVLVQKCSACGALNFTTDQDAPVRVCHNCHKTRVASIVPIPYVETPPVEEAEEPAHERVIATAATAEVPFDNGKDKEDSAQWQGMLGNIRKSVEAADEEDDDEDEDEAADWSDILGGSAMPKAEPVKKDPPITLTAVRYGSLSFTVEPKPDMRYMLGRSAEQGAFLENDHRVSNQHCYLYFKSGAWYVKDNHSSNGTAVNSRDIGLNGESRLADGDELKLGHHPDSMAFKVMIK